MLYILMSVLAVSAADKRMLLISEDESRAEHTGRESFRTRGGGQGPAAFEFANSSGAGMGPACELPNWNLQSEDLATSWTHTASGGPAIPVVVVNQDTSPTGTLTADKVTFDATAGITQFSESKFPDNGTSICNSGVTCTASIWVKGVSGSGTLDLCNCGASTCTCTPCAFTSTDYVRCSYSTSNATATAGWYIGNNSAYNTGTVSRPAQAVYLWGGQLNIGATASTYYANTTTNKAYTPTSTRGAVMTSTRGSNAMCSKGDPNAPANGDLVMEPTDQARVMSGGSGPLGILVEPATGNYALRSQELENAAWLTYQGVIGAPTITVNAAIAPDGTLTADRVQIPACPTAGNYSSKYAYNSVPATPHTFSGFVKGVSTGGTIAWCIYNSATTTTACTDCVYNAATWTRCSVYKANASVTGTNTPVFGCINGDILNIHSGNTGAVDAYIWGLQDEPLAYATSYVPTTSAAVGRSADGNNSFAPSPAPATDLEGSAAGSVLSLSTSTAIMGPLLIQGTVNRYLYASGTGTFMTYDGTNNPYIAVSFTINNTFRAWTSWSGSTLTITNATANTVSTSAFDGTMGNGSPLYLGVYSPVWGVTSPPFVVKQVCLDPNPSRCR